MSDEPERRRYPEHLGELFHKFFPNVGCLRCGNEDFYILPATREGFQLDANVALDPPFFRGHIGIPTRCGHIERHLTEQLRKTPTKPIEMGTKGGVAS